MAPKKPTKTGGKAGSVPSRPGKPMAGLRDKTVRVPAAFNAQTVDPTNQRGAGQRITGDLAGGRAGKPAGRIAAPAPKPASTPSPRIKVPAEFNAKTMTSAKPKPRPGTIPATRKPAAPAPKPAAKPAATKPLTTTPRVRTTTSYGPPANQIKFQGAPKAGNFSGNLRRLVQGTNLLTKANTLAVGLGGGELLGKAGIAFRQNSPLDSKNDSARRRADPRYQPLRQMSAAEMRNAPKLTQYDPNSPAAKARAKAAVGPEMAAKVAARRSNAPAPKPAAGTSRFAGARDKAMAKAKAIKGSPVLGPKKVGSGGGGGGGKLGAIAQAFDKSFASARKAGKATFMFRGKKYTTEMA